MHQTLVATLAQQFSECDGDFGVYPKSFGGAEE